MQTKQSWDAMEDAHTQHLCWNPNGGVIIKHWLIWIRVDKHHQILSRDSFGDFYSQLQLFLKTVSCSLWVCGWRMEQKMNKSKTKYESFVIEKLKVRKTWRDSPWIVGVRLETWDVGLRHQTWHLGWFQSELSCEPVLFIIIIIIMSTGVLLWSSQLLLVSSVYFRVNFRVNSD